LTSSSDKIRFGVIIVGIALAGCEPANVEVVSRTMDSCDVDYAAINATEMNEIDAGLSVYRRFVVEELSEGDLSEEEIETLDRMQAILDSRERPVDQYDVMILDSANTLLSSESVWDRADDRKCEPQDEAFSLFCSLYFGSMNTIGEYQHRRTALQEVRFAIEDATGGREFEHRMRDFNNLPETSLSDVKAIIHTASERVQSRLDLQAECAL
jgi:hypothetical protein